MLSRKNPQRFEYKGNSDWRDELLGVEELCGYVGIDQIHLNLDITLEDKSVEILRREGLLHEVME